jgi:hypothetical protein
MGSHWGAELETLKGSPEAPADFSWLDGSGGLYGLVSPGGIVTWPTDVGD